jgi:uncharacterized protein (DUF2164 family)
MRDFKKLMATSEYDFLRDHERLGKRFYYKGIRESKGLCKQYFR